MRLIIFGIISVILIIISGCLKPTDVDILLSVPEEIVIDGRKYVLETYLYRDFMPECPPDGESLFGYGCITAVDSQIPSDNITENQVWIIKGNDIWQSDFREIWRYPNSYYPNQIIGLFINGPKWGPDITVDVVLRVIDTTKNQEYLLRASNQYIQMVCK